MRNVALVGHSGAGKTTLVEALLASTGAIPRPGRVENGTTVSDFDDVEVRQQRSVNLTLAPVVHAGIKVNLLDTPGYADFTGDLRAGCAPRTPPCSPSGHRRGRRPDPDAVGGMRLRRDAPRRGDHQAGPPAGRLRRGAARLPAAFGDSVAPLYLPVTDGPGALRGLIGLLSGKFFDYSGGSRAEREPDPDWQDRATGPARRADRGDHPGERG